MPAPLESFLRYLNSGDSAMTPEMWSHFGGDDMLEQVRKYDPNAHAIDVEMGGGEGGSQGMGKRIEYDRTKMPTSKSGTLGLDLNPSNLHPTILNPRAVEHSDAYGDVTNSKNLLKARDPLWTKLAPLFVAVVAPYAAAAMAAGGIGVGASAAGSLGAGGAAEAGSGAAGAANWGGAAGGAAGGTSSVTGSGLTGVNSLDLPRWAAQAIGKAPQIARGVNESNNPLGAVAGSLLGPASSAAGIDPNITSGAFTLGNLARLSRGGR